MIEPPSSVGSGLQRPLRCLIQQPALPAYRVPFFRELASRPGLDIHLMYASTEGLPNADADGFSSEPRRLRTLPGSFFWDWEPVKRFRGGGWDVVCLTWNTRYASLFPTIDAVRRSGGGVVLWGHGYSKREAAWRQNLRIAAARRADAVVLYSEEGARRCIDAGVPRERVFVAPNALGQDEIQAARQGLLTAPDRLRAFRDEHGLAPGPVVLFVSRLYAENRVDLLLHAAAALRGEFPHIRVVVVGKGPDEDRLRELAATLGLGGVVLFPGAVYGEASIAPWFLSADLFCYPANIGLSILHAMGYGLPVVTGDDIASHNPEIAALRDGRNGALFRHGSAESLAAVLGGLLRDPNRRAAMAEEARRTAAEEFSIRRMADGMERAFRAAARSARARSAG